MGCSFFVMNLIYYERGFICALILETGNKMGVKMMEVVEPFHTTGISEFYDHF